MINEKENNNSLKGMSDLEYQKNDVEMMRYRVNGLSHKLGLSAMILSLVGGIVCLNSMNPSDFQVILIILLNIFILLFGFLCSERSKNYIKSGAISQACLGLICLARVFYIPLELIINYSKYLSPDDAISAEGEKFLGNTIISKTSSITAFLPANGYFRGIVAMICFGLAFVCFLVAGIIGYKKSIRLNSYLDSIKVKK